MKKYVFSLLIIIFGMLSCRKEPTVIVSEKIPLPQQTNGFFLLNEGKMGSGNATLDYYNVDSSIYYRNIYSETNPGVVKYLGDVGNDLKIYGNKLYAVMNCSNLVEVMRASDAKHIIKFDVLNCRYICFHEDKVYVSSYAGPVIGSQQDSYKRLGVVLEFDTVDFKKTREVTVGYQPEEMAIVNGKLYVANSGGYTADDYDRTVSVIDLVSFEEIKKIDVGINLHRLKADNYGNIFVNSRGDYNGQLSSLYVIDSTTDRVMNNIEVSISNFCIVGDTAYVYGSDFDNSTGKTSISYNMVNVKTQTVVEGSFITDETNAKIKIPYGIAVSPTSRDIYVTDAVNHLVSGVLYCFDRHGKLKWSVVAGNNPAHIAFTK